MNPDQLRISVEMGDDYQPSDRLRAALGELAATLADEESDNEVAGFNLKYELVNYRSLSYDSASRVVEKGTGGLKQAAPFDGKGNDVFKL